MKHTILYLNEVGWIGGAERVLLDLVTHLDRERYQPVVVCPEEGELPDALRKECIPTHIVPFYGLRARNPLRYFETINRVKAIVKECSADIIHVNQQYFSNYGVAIGKSCKLPVIIHLRGVESDDFYHQFGNWISQADKIICISRAVQSGLLKYALERFSIKKASAISKRSSVIYDGMRFSCKRVLPSAMRSELGIAPDAKVVGIVGQVIPEKGVAEFVEAADIIRKTCTSAHFLVVGEDPYPGRDFVSQMQSRVKQMGLAEHFTFTGFREDAADMFHVMDVSVLASWREAFGRVILESMAAGVPVVATNVGGVPEIIEHGKSGILIKKKSAEAIAGGVIEVLNLSEEERCAMVVEGKKCLMKFGIDAHVENIQLVYDELLAEAGVKSERRKEVNVEKI